MRVRVLFLCQTNATRSILAEALLNEMGKREFEAFSAGTCPLPIHPLTVAALQENYVDTARLRSKPISEFEGETFDYVISLCAPAEDDYQTPFTGRIGQFRWTFADPALCEGSDGERGRAFRKTVMELRMRLSLFVTIIHRTDYARSFDLVTSAA